MAKRRLSDKEFWTILRVNAGLYSRTARAITKEYGMSYTRQAVKDRAERQPVRLLDILEENLDVAEESLQSLLRSKNENVRFRAAEFYLKTKGKERGYVERAEITGKDSAELIPARILTKEEAVELIKKIENNC